VAPSSASAFPGRLEAVAILADNSGSISTDGSRIATRRALLLVSLIAVLVLIASSDSLHAWVTSFLPWAETIIRGRPILGASLFILLAALSAMLAFMSSAVFVPVGLYVWGKTTTMVLLWAGWVAGGVCAYAISRYLGRPVVKALVSWPALERYERRISRKAPFGLVLLFQLALPSEVPGYVLGLVRYHFWKYIAALALAELPYAVATIYLGSGFIERRTYLLISVGGVVALFGLALYTLHKRVSDEWRPSVREE
jgi:uncharacterized membrane protein YdjX (TVP38/TMEM64 family)